LHSVPIKSQRDEFKKSCSKTLTITIQLSLLRLEYAWPCYHQFALLSLGKQASAMPFWTWRSKWEVISLYAAERLSQCKNEMTFSHRRLAPWIALCIFNLIGDNDRSWPYSWYEWEQSLTTVHGPRRLPFLVQALQALGAAVLSSVLIASRLPQYSFYFILCSKWQLKYPLKMALSHKGYDSEIFKDRIGIATRRSLAGLIHSSAGRWAADVIAPSYTCTYILDSIPNMVITRYSGSPLGDPYQLTLVWSSIHRCVST
jgi:hypothetical protein